MDTPLDEALALGRARRALPAPPARRLIRKRAGISQKDIAAELKVTREAVSLWESGARTPSPSHLPGYLAILQRCASEGL